MRAHPHFVFAGCFVAAGLWAAVPAPAQMPERMVMDTIRGGVYPPPPFDGNTRSYGCCISTMKNWKEFDPEAIKGVQSMVNHFDVEDSHNAGWRNFVPALRAYEADEIRRGRPGLFYTATYAGKKRPVVFSKLINRGLRYALNVGDDRLIKFYIHQYVRDKHNPEALPNWWIGFDNCNWLYTMYGVLDDEGKVVTNITWDKPFPQNQREYEDALAYFCRRFRELAPDIRILTNEWTMPDYSRWKEIWGPISGCCVERSLDESGDPTPAERKRTYDFIRRLRTLKKDLVQVFQTACYDSTKPNHVRTVYCRWLAYRGPNAFFQASDRTGGGFKELHPALYAEMRNALGDPVADAVDVPEPNKPEGYCLISRRCEGGIVYMNRTGAAKTIDLPAGQTWYDHDGNPVKQITIPDLEADYVTTARGPRCAKPFVNPRRPELVTAPLMIHLTTEPYTTGAEIYYTLDGSEPTRASTRYTGPFPLTRSAVVRTRAYKAGLLESFVAQATYRITNEDPAVQFHLAEDGLSDVFTPYYILVALSHTSGKPVSVDYAVTGGSATRDVDYTVKEGTLTFAPGQQYAYVKLDIVAHPDKEPRTIQLTLRNPRNATLGKNTTFTYTINQGD